MSTVYNRLRPASQSFMRLQTLLDRYPDLRQQELAELGELASKLTLMEEAILSGSEHRSKTLHQFRRDHAEGQRMPAAELIAFLSLPTLFAAILLWWFFA